MIASSTSRPLVTSPTTATSSKHVGEDPRVALAAPDTPREQQQPDAADRDERGRDLGNLDRREAAERGQARRDAAA